MPGGMGVNLVKQYRQAGLASIPFLSAFTADELTLPAEKDDALGFLGGANWAPDMDNPQTKAFVKAYEAAYNSVPGTYAMQGYDAAMLIDSAIKGTGGKLSDKDALRAELKKANFTSLRGKFKFGVNNYPDPGLLSRQGGQARRRQVRDRDRAARVRGLRRPLRGGMRDEIAARRPCPSRSWPSRP